MDLSSIGLNLGYGVSGAGQTHKPSGDLDEATSRFIKNKDQNGDGVLSAAEISISDEAFKRADANGDGQLDADELKSSVESIGKELAAQGPKGPPPSDDEDDDDDDDDESSTWEEIFEKADTNGDGVLSSEEFEASDEINEALRMQRPQGPPPGDLDRATEDLVQELDENGDGTLSSDEIDISQEVFDQADTDGDGQLSFDELKANAQTIGEELIARDSVLKQYSLADFLEGDSDGDDSINLTI
jgi:Ca2+-binding EF-hand superfamily protein